MKVLMINSVCGIGSTGRICTDLASALEAQGHEVRIAYGREEVPGQYRKYAVSIGTELDVIIHGFLARTLDRSGFGSTAATRRFIRWVRNYDPDIIHLHNLHGYYINLEILFRYLRICGKKIIWTLHDCWAFTGHSAYCEGASCEKWKSGCHHCPSLKTYPISYTDHSESNWKKKKSILTGIPNLTLAVPSHWLEGLVRESFLSEYPVQVIRSGIDIAQFHPLQNDFRNFYNIGNKHMILGLIGSMDDSKGLPEMIQLVNRLDDSVQLVLVGVTDEQKAILPPNITAIGQTRSPRELAYIKNAADLILDSSYWKNDQIDGFPTARPAEDGQNIIGPGYWAYKQSLGLIGKKVLLGVASGWDKRKGLDDIIKLSCITDSRIVLAGLTKNQRQNLPENIIAYEKTNNVHDLQKLYAIADYYINPTYEDNFPVTNIEALACGTPVVTYRTGGSVETADAATGLVIEKGAYKDLDVTDRFDEILCRRRSKRFTKEEMLRAYLHLY